MTNPDRVNPHMANLGTANLGILLSGRGSNFLSIHRALEAGQLPGARIAVVVSNLPDAPGLEAARRLGLPAVLHDSRGRARADHDAAVLATLRAHAVDLVCLSGYMRLLSAPFVRAFPGRILNIHPSLLPAFPGLHAQRQAFEYGVKVAGCTVHLVDEELDHGVILLQRAVPVSETDTADTLRERILAEEHVAYPQAIALLLAGSHVVRGRRYVPRAPAAPEP